MADYSNVGDELDIVNVTFPVGRTSRGGRPAVNMPTDMMLVYFFLYRIFSSYPQTRINAK